MRQATQLGQCFDRFLSSFKNHPKLISKRQNFFKYLNHILHFQKILPTKQTVHGSGFGDIPVIERLIEGVTILEGGVKGEYVVRFPPGDVLVPRLEQRSDVSPEQMRHAGDADDIPGRNVAVFGLNVTFAGPVGHPFINRPV